MQGVTRLDILNFISHGVTKVPGGESDAHEAPVEPDEPRREEIV